MTETKYVTTHMQAHIKKLITLKQTPVDIWLTIVMTSKYHS